MAGKTSAADLGLDLEKGTPQQLYKWFLACLLFGRPIRQSMAVSAWRELLARGFTSPKKFREADRERLRAVLDEGGYARFDYVMSDELHEVMAAVEKHYGSVSKLVKTSSSRRELSDRMQAFSGVGPVTSRIFLRDLPESVLPR